MADEQTTTEVADNPTPETEQNSESVLGSGISDNQTETDWKSSLPEELRNEPTLQNLNDVESLAKTVVHQQKMIGSRIPLPKSDEEKAELYNKLGRPTDPTKYDLSIPDTHKQHFNETAVGEFKNVAHKIGLNNDQVNALLEYQVNQIDNTGQLQEAQMNVQREEAEQNLKQEWGFEYDKNLRSAMRAIDVYGDEGLKEVLNKALVQGEIDTFMGFNFIRTERLDTNSSSNRLVLAFAKSGIGLAVGSDIQTRISERADKNYATQVFLSMTIGATRIEDEKVVEIECTES
jgi:hypothetical protein